MTKETNSNTPAEAAGVETAASDIAANPIFFKADEDPINEELAYDRDYSSYTSRGAGYDPC